MFLSGADRIISDEFFFFFSGVVSGLRVIFENICFC